MHCLSIIKDRIFFSKCNKTVTPCNNHKNFLEKITINFDIIFILANAISFTYLCYEKGIFKFIRYTAFELKKQIINNRKNKNNSISNDITVYPTHYYIKFWPYLLSSLHNTNNNDSNEKQTTFIHQFIFRGYTEIRIISNNDNVKEITLHSRNLLFYKLPKLCNRNETINIINWEWNERTQKLKILLSNPMKKKLPYFLKFHYIGVINKEMKGIFQQKYQRNDQNEIWFIGTQFEPVNARMAFPCFDEPKYKAIFNLSINHDVKYHAISNTKILFQDKISEPGRITTMFFPTSKISTCSIKFLLTDFKVKINNTEFIDIHALKNVFYEKFNEYTMIPYERIMQNKKIHLKNFLSLIADNTEILLLNVLIRNFQKISKKDCNKSKENIIKLIIFEWCHQCFGSYITSKYWNTVWLNEGISKYFEKFFLHVMYPEWDIDKTFIIDVLQKALDEDSKRCQSMTCLSRDIQNDKKVMQQFNKINCEKAASIIRMIQHIMGAFEFREAIRAYLRDENIAVGNVTPYDFFRALKRKWKNKLIDLNEIEHDWTEQPGYPLITIEINSDCKSLSIRQERFLIEENSLTDDDICYTVPFNYITNRNIDYDDTTPICCLKKTKDTQIIVLDENIDWIIANKLQTYYYRCNYDNRTWQNIRNALKNENFNNIHEINRAQIIDDLLIFGEIGLIGYRTVFSVLEYLEYEFNYVPWYTFFKRIPKLILMMKPTLYKKFSQYMLILLNNVYIKLGIENNFGTNNNDDERLINKLNRQQILEWCCRFGHKGCVNMSIELFKNFYFTGKMIPNNIRLIVYSTCIREGGNFEFDFFLKKFKEEKNFEQQEIILKALGCTKLRINIQKYVNCILYEDCIKDKFNTFTYILEGNPENAEILWEYVQTHFKSFEKTFVGKFTIFKLIEKISMYFTSKWQKLSLENFFIEKEIEIGEYGCIIKNALRTIEKNLEWSNKYLPGLIEYLSTKLIVS